MFKLNTNYVGPIQKVRIEHDNSGKSPGCKFESHGEFMFIYFPHLTLVLLFSIGFLERIVITDLKDPNVNYYCPCSRWLSKDEDDGLISRDLLATDDIFSIKKSNPTILNVFFSIVILIL